MQGLAAILGQPDAVGVLERALLFGKLHHAYLFEGPEGVGKATTARALAMAVNCERGRRGCGECPACQKIRGGHHPDLIVFDMSGKGLTERVRDLLPTLGFRPHEARARVVIFDPADDLAQGRAEAANALLKTLEEPPAETYFILCTTQPRRLPVTVRSRCQRVRFQPLADPVITAFLRERGVTPAAAEALAARADGSLARAAALAEAGDEDGESPATRVARLVRAARSGRAEEIFAAASDLGGDREAAIALCGDLWRLLRARLLMEEALAEPRVSAFEQAEAGRLFGDAPIGGAALLAALDATNQAIEALAGNVAPGLAMEHLLFRMSAGAAS
jgi:DNA polymerase-3 subunit delta'